MSTKRKIEEVIFFTYGDSSDASTWSNVPYLFTRTLEKKGITVRRVNLYEVLTRLTKIADKIIRAEKKVLRSRSTFRFQMSRIFIALAYRNIKRAVKTFPNADLCIFACYDFYNKFSSIPTLLFGDWTLEILVRDRMRREPDSPETRYIRHQNEVMTKAEHVVTLFPYSQRLMLGYCPESDARHMGMNVVNDMNPKPHPAADTLIEGKRAAQKILFIGNAKYIDGARRLVEAFRLIRRELPVASLDIIGMTGHELAVEGIEGVRCHGYLRKDVPAEAEKYYSLLSQASVFVNPTRGWAGYSSTIEAMFYHTPVVVAPYDDFTTEFGKDISFGAFQHSDSADDLAKNILSVMTSEDYARMCRDAHNAVAGYTWDKYVDKILATVSLNP